MKLIILFLAMLHRLIIIALAIGCVWMDYNVMAFFLCVCLFMLDAPRDK